MKTAAAMTLGLILAAAASAAASAGEPAPLQRVNFTAKPTAIRDGDVVKISFAVSAPTDVAVFIDDAKGNVVRHLVAGVLGPNPPPPLKAGLAQELVWDGKADYGKPAAGGPFRVRVALGLGAKYDRVYSRPINFSGLCSLAVGPDGALYVNHNYDPTTHGAHSQLMVFNRDCSYRRTLLPFPSTPGGEAARGLATMELGGRPAPAERERVTDLYNWLAPTPGSTMAVSPDGKTLYVPVCGGNPFRPAEIQLLSTEGGGLLAKHTLDKSKVGELPEFGSKTHLAISSDGKSLFITGLRDRRSKAETTVIYRVGLPGCTGLGVFFGERNVPGKDATHLGALPGGLASDGKGHLLACDTANNRIVVIGEEDGKLKGEMAHASPWNVGVSKANGVVYVANQVGSAVTLTRFSGWKDAHKTAELPIPRRGGGAHTINMVADCSTEAPVIWLTTSILGHTVRVEDRAGKFEATEPGWEKHSNPTGRRHEGYLGLVVDRNTKEVYVRNNGAGEFWERFNDETGAVDFLTLPREATGSAGQGTQIAPAPDGVIYGVRWRHNFWKWDRNGKSIVWEEPRKPTEEEVKLYPEKVPPPGPSKDNFARIGMVDMAHTIGVRWSDGHIFVLEPHMIDGGDGGRVPKALHEYLPTGKRVTTVDNPIIWKVSDPAVGPKFDAAGNIYIAEVVRPKGWKYPPEWAAFLASRKDAEPKSMPDTVASLYGSIVKFGPKGGMIHFDGREPFVGQPRLDPALKTMEVDYFLRTRLFPVKITGAEWIHPGVGHVGHYSCNCENMTFDVDEFGRVFFPDLCLYQIRVIDTAGNAITTIGGYGNADNCGPESAVIDPKTGQPRPRRADDPKDLKSPFAEPDIAMAWPTSVGATDRHIYIGDAVNRRMVRGRLTYAAGESCEVK